MDSTPMFTQSGDVGRQDANGQATSAPVSGVAQNYSKMRLCRRVSLRCILVFCLILAFVCAGAICALIALSDSFLRSQKAAETAAAAAAARNLGESSLRSVNIALFVDFMQATTTVEQMKPFFNDAQTRASADPADAITAYNATFTSLYLARASKLNEPIGFVWNLYYSDPATAATRSGSVAGLAVYRTDVNGDGIYDYVFPVTENNDMTTTYLYTMTGTLSNTPIIDYATPLSVWPATSAAATLPTYANRSTLWTKPQVYSRSPGDVIYFMTYTALLRPFAADGINAKTVSDDYFVIALQTFLDAEKWPGWMKGILGAAASISSMHLVDENARMIASSSDVLHAWRVNCTKTYTTTYEAECYDMPMAQMIAKAGDLNFFAGSFSALGDLVSQFETSMNMGPMNGVLTTTVDNPATAGNDLVMVAPTFKADGLKLYLGYLGTDAATQKASDTTTVIFATLGTVIVFGLLLLVAFMFGLIGPLRDAIATLGQINDLDVDAMLARVAAVIDGDDAGSSSSEAASARPCHGGDVTVEGAMLQMVTNSLSYAVLSFARFMPIDVVRELLTTQSLADVNLKYVKLHVLFVDIAAFTTISEGLGIRYPHILSLLLNRFFTIVCDSVADTGGTVDKFIGDCVMAFWGAPKPHSFSATAALLTAMDIARSVRQPPMAEDGTLLPQPHDVLNVSKGEGFLHNPSIQQLVRMHCDSHHPSIVPAGASETEGTPQPSYRASTSRSRDVALDKHQQHALALQDGKKRESTWSKSDINRGMATSVFNFSAAENDSQSHSLLGAAVPADNAGAGGVAPTTSSPTNNADASRVPAGQGLAAFPTLNTSGRPAGPAPLSPALIPTVVAHCRSGESFSSSTQLQQQQALNGSTSVLQLSHATGGGVNEHSFASETGAGAGGPEKAIVKDGTMPPPHRRDTNVGRGDVTDRSQRSHGTAGGKAKGSEKTASATTTAGYNEQKMKGLALQLRRRSANSSTRESRDAGGRYEEVDELERVLQRGAESAPITVRVGVHGGYVNVGNMGCVQRLSYTALGDAVNTASRLEGFVKHIQGPCEIICGAAVVNEAHPAILARYVGPVRLAGKHDTIEVCQVLGAALLNADETYTLIQRRPVAATTNTGAGAREKHAAPTPDTAAVEMTSAACGADATSPATFESVPDADRAVTNFLISALGGLDAAHDSQVLDAIATFNHYVRVAHTAAAAVRNAKRHQHQRNHHHNRSTHEEPHDSSNPRTMPVHRMQSPTTRSDSSCGDFGTVTERTAAWQPATTTTPGTFATASSPLLAAGAPLGGSMNQSSPQPALQALEAALQEAVTAVHAAYDDIPLALRLLFAVEDSFICMHSHSGAIECNAK